MQRGGAPSAFDRLLVSGNNISQNLLNIEIICKEKLQTDIFRKTNLNEELLETRPFRYEQYFMTVYFP